MSARALELEIASDPHELPAVREAARAWCLRHGWEDERIADIVLALDEALTNVIRHGYEGSVDERIFVHVSEVTDTRHGTGVEVRIRDFGKQVALENICGRDLDKPRPGGLGVHIIRSLMDVAEYQHADGGGMRLIMRKYRRTYEAPGGADEGPA